MRVSTWMAVCLWEAGLTRAFGEPSGFLSSAGQDNSPKVHERRDTADALSDYCQDVFQREKSHPMRLIYAARRVSEATDSYDFICSVTTLFAPYRRPNEFLHYDN